ncbi:MAG TPA: bifunctional metallophosphatase/5'-nucleotidase [Marmoricola sp.]|nr:bifunctional metallophosphatase/5'-nucleotidase [Marmoricola sp.]
MHHHTKRRLASVAAAAACAATAIATAQVPSQAAKAPKPPKGPLMEVQLLSFNDFHGNLEAPSGSAARNTTGYTLGSNKLPAETGPSDGGVEYLASHLAKARDGHPASLTVAAGDLIGASPLLSAAFHDEPAIESMNALGLDVSAVGNHEFDEGYKELQRMADGGCLGDGDGENNQDSCPGGKSFAGAEFDYLAANVKYAGTDDTILPPYTIKNVKGAKIGFIGMTLEGTPDIVTASGVAGLEFADEVETANRLVPVLKKQGVEAIVVLLHEGGTPAKVDWTDPNGKTWQVNPTWDQTCAKGNSLTSSSPILPIAQNLDAEIDMVVSGHTHSPYVCSVTDPAGQPRLVTSASSFGRLYTDTRLTYDRRSGDIVRSKVTGANVRVSRDIAQNAEQSALIETYKELVRPIASKVIGHITDDVTKTANTAGESQLGDLIADAQLADTSVRTGGEVPKIAFMNPGGIRADLIASNSPYDEPEGDVTYEEAFSVQPFNNYLVSLTLTGQQIYDLLGEQVNGTNDAQHKVLQVSEGFSYTYTDAGPVDGSVELNGEPIDKAASYRVVTNNFLADGGDGFPTFRDAQNVYYGGLDIDAFANHLSAQEGGYTPGPLDRITKQ